MLRYWDRIGRYFTCFHEATGESTVAEIVSLYENGETSRYSFNHADCDGQGALLKSCEEGNGVFVLLPKQRNEAMPSLHRQIQYLKKYLNAMMKASKPTLSRSPSTQDETSSVAYRTLTLEDSLAIKECGKKLGVTPTTFLTWTLHKAIAEQSGVSHHTCNWSIPVSLRGPLSEPHATANHAVPLFLQLDSTTSIRQTHTIIQDQLSKGMHWGAYRMLMLLGFLPSFLYKAIIRHDESRMARKGNWFAVLSNIGSIIGDPKIVAKYILISTSPSAPIKGVSLTWNGRMSLTVSTHSSFLKHSLDADRLLATWLAVISKLIAEDRV